ncbi:sensor histidine kinase [Streptomyces millisiae]|uniref:histidine kinase n=1 Tax=Streptomyces millisiae TaxID=3075542 RepID=A0ABU2LRN6_9ACTN|nr:HAMP domain-containing sensor histidine kinase [Streptomyces sp. DSM 44918]MDT0319708.1 HAMP domain-containing sensor histidine kinase [Streptomyces sp. DSM 44918]
MASVRARATLGATAVVAVALVVAGLLLLNTLRANITRQIDLEAEVTARGVATELATGTTFAELNLDSDTPVQVLDEDGAVRAVSDDLQAISGTGNDQVTPVPENQRPATGDDDGDDDDGDDGDDDEALRPGEVAEGVTPSAGSATIDGETHDYRFARVEVETAHGVEAFVYAGAPLDVERAAISSARTSMLVGFPPLLALVAVVTWLVTRRALGPVEGIRREMAAITHSEDLSRRVPEPGSRDEIGRLARTTNETLAALESSVERQRRFVADASHELRSPIASLRTQLEVGEAHPELLDVPGAVQDTVRLQQLAADLLLLARLDAGERPLAGAVRLDRLVADELTQRAGDRVPVASGEVAEATVTGSRGQLGRVLGNLLDNAQRHAAGRVRVTLRREGDQALLEVADDGAGVPAGDRERIFERFVRLDDARSRDDGGAGLGLAIARDVATRHGGTLTVTDAPKGGALFTLRIPLRGSGAAA